MEVSNRPWDPYQTLKIEAISAGFTCVGYAASKGRRCHNAIAAANRREASTIVSSLSKIDFMSANLESLLTELASLLLCRRWHQDQASTVTKRWLGKVDKLKGEELAQRRSEEDILSALSAIFLGAARTNETRQPATTPPVATTGFTARSAARSLPLSGNRPLPRAVHEPASPQAEEPATILPSPALDDQTPGEADPHRPNTTDLSPQIPIPVAGYIPIAPGRGSSTEETHDRTTVKASGESHDHATVTAAEAETECSICYEEMSSDSSLVSCRTQCRHTFHTECMNSWLETSDALERTRTCPYW